MKSQAESRQQRFDEVAAHARHLADHSLQEIDSVLACQDKFTEQLEERVHYGELTNEEATELYREWVGEGMPIADIAVLPSINPNQLSFESGVESEAS